MPTKNEEIKLDLNEKPRGIVKYKTGEDSDKLFSHIKGYPAVKSDIIMFVLANALRNGNRIISFSPQQLKDFIGYKKSVSNKEFIETISWVFKDLASVTYANIEIKNGEEHEINRPFFAYTDINKTTHWVSVQVSEKAAELFNNFTKSTRFNRFSLLQYFHIQSKYSKNLFRLLKEWRTKGHRSMDIDELRDKLDVPKSYKPADINRRIIKRSYEDLMPYFNNYQVEIDNLRSKKNKTTYVFMWTPEEHRSKDVLDDPRMTKLIAYYNIASNKNATEKAKGRALDRYFNLKMGTYRKQHLKNRFYFLDLIYGSNYDHSIMQDVKKMDTDLLNFMLGRYEQLNDAKKLDSDGLLTLSVLNEEKNKRAKENPENKDLDLSDIPLEIEKHPDKIKGYTYLRSTNRLKPLEKYDDRTLNLILQRFTQAASKGKDDINLLSDLTTITQFILKKKRDQ